MAFDPMVLKYAPWAVSKVGTLELCPQQFAWQYVIKEKQGPKSGASLVGTTAHTILEEALTSLETPLYEYAKALCEKLNLLHDETKQILNFIPSIRSYADRIESFKKTAGVHLSELEKKLAIKTNFQKADFFDKNDNILRGILDQLLITKDQIGILIDHKSGKKRKIDDHSTQFNVYRILICAAYPDIKGVQCAVNYIGSTKLEWSPRPDRTPGAWTRGEIEGQLHPWLEHYLGSIVRHIRPVDAGTQVKKPGWPCEYCGFIHLCEEGQAEVQRRLLKRQNDNL